MRMRPRRGALGLRGRIVGAVLVTTVATLGVAALALLGPLEQSLRTEAKKTLIQSVRGSATAGIADLHLDSVLDLLPRDPNSGITDPKSGRKNTGSGQGQRVELARQEQALGSRLGASVTLFGYQSDRTGANSRPVPAYPPAAIDEAIASKEVEAAFRTHRLRAGFGTVDGGEIVEVAIPLKIQGERYVLAVRRPITEVAGAVHVVRTAFLTAALAGLVLTLILAIPLSARIVRRLKRLRQAALQVAQEGPAVDVPEDRARDEVGDLDTYVRDHATPPPTSGGGAARVRGDRIA